MEHIIVIWKRLKERNEKGEYNFSIDNRYQLTEEEVVETETLKANEDVDDDDPYMYYAEIEETKL